MVAVGGLLWSGACAQLLLGITVGKKKGCIAVEECVYCKPCFIASLPFTFILGFFWKNFNRQKWKTIGSLPCVCVCVREFSYVD